MRHHCPICQRSFDEAGFCPFDRSTLVAETAIAGKATVISAPLTAQPDVDARHVTLPQAAKDLAQTQPRGAVPGEAGKLRARSAADSPTGVLEAFTNQREDAYDALIGQTLDGRYLIQAKIGEGGMGVVFAARHAVIERPLAIKVLKREVMRDAATIKRFVQEAKAASRIGHPNIVDVTDFGTTPDGMTYSVMEFVGGDTLSAAMRAAAPFPAERVIKIGAQIARALGAAHDKGIVHRDLKPENVFLTDRDGRTDFVKIVDFGIAKVAPTSDAQAAEPRLTRAGSVFGTPEYMAPEQAAGRGDTDARVDIYALGVILYEMLCGRVPHRGDNMVRTLAMQMLDAPIPPSQVRPDLGIHPELEAVILHALAKKREQRHATMGELLAALEKVHVTIGQSLTGSPLYALAPLPPGAQPQPAMTPPSLIAPRIALPGPPPAIDATAHDRPTRRPTDAPPMPRRSNSPTAKVRHEPEFVAADKKPTYEHVWTDDDLPRPATRRWPLVGLGLLGLLALGGIVGAIVLAGRTREPARAPADARARTADDRAPEDAAIAELADAGVPVDALDDVVVVLDDIVVGSTDAGPRRPTPPRDAAIRPPVGPIETPHGRGTIMVQVLTKPEGAQLYVGTSYRGPGGTTLEEAHGATVDVRCHLKGYKDGTVQIRFDGDAEVVLCTMARIKVCIDGVKNPFDDCEPAEP